MKLFQEIIVFLLLWEGSSAASRRNLRANFSLETRSSLAMAVQSAVESPNGKVDEDAMEYAISLGLDRNTVLKSAALELRKNGDPYAVENRIKAKIPKSAVPPGTEIKGGKMLSSLADPSTVKHKVDSRVFYEEDPRDHSIVVQRVGENDDGQSLFSLEVLNEVTANHYQ
mmetsp:Transcript_18985/g.28148  ORF Transcript_18985/g.28148 Transcript_18985/m.28148 type:complete len:170 (+) Transcript_18985:201-710(+)|eukprot:CAMPEP_0194204210 /NCGR_PEP_ID=MMETSP0156-20130528/3803_1 /TAXON_ID=33649 /ORGANISM="Thalassionema nitzschioides, Strain L26-B" /LENGTH=169 /DNA_ID=CAMNT_0038930169 /DNA_START=170 /DNA_END=679 /DNA_ORIENTATION=+